jgi:hypothetical protein
VKSQEESNDSRYLSDSEPKVHLQGKWTLSMPSIEAFEINRMELNKSDKEKDLWNHWDKPRKPSCGYNLVMTFTSSWQPTNNAEREMSLGSDIDALGLRRVPATVSVPPLF